MATISFHPGYSWDTLPKTTSAAKIDQAALLAWLEELRAQWFEASGGDLSSVTLNLGLLLDDIETACKGKV